MVVDDLYLQLKGVGGAPLHQPLRPQVHMVDHLEVHKERIQEAKVDFFIFGIYLWDFLMFRSLTLTHIHTLRIGPFYFEETQTEVLCSCCYWGNMLVTLQLISFGRLASFKCCTRTQRCHHKTPIGCQTIHFNKYPHTTVNMSHIVKLQLRYLATRANS